MGRHVLIADPDPQTARLLAPVLRHRGYQVSAVKNGSRALEICVLRAPDLVLFDAACPLLDAQTFRQIVRANPHTEQLPVLITGSADLASPPSLRDGFLLKPFNADEVLSRIEQVLRRVDAARQTRRGDQGMEGTLAQLAVTDLLQVLGQNRKSGRLELSGPRGHARVHLTGGQVADAQAEGATGVKALFRLLQWKEGLFAFIPGELSQPGDIHKGVEELLLEGLRQADELPAIRAALPDPDAPLVLAPAADQLLGEQHPVTAEVLALCRSGVATVGEILQRSRATDYSAAQALLTLLRRGLVIPQAGAAPARKEQRPLLPPGGAHALRARLRHPGSEGPTRGKILFASPDGPALGAFFAKLAALPQLRLDQGKALPGFGTAGRLELGDDLALDVVILPTAEANRPLWQPFASRALGAVVLFPTEHPGSEAAASLVAFLGREQGLPVVVPGHVELPAELARPGSATGGPADPVEALRELLALAVRARPRAV
ncbi:MAG TPA: DUF4388 domain-containing protein [Myxococcales bacterium]|nr:DUF4388 domain-containing protein [Myxococcales bacterium]